MSFDSINYPNINLSINYSPIIYHSSVEKKNVPVPWSTSWKCRKCWYSIKNKNKTGLKQKLQKQPCQLIHRKNPTRRERRESTYLYNLIIKLFQHKMRQIQWTQYSLKTRVPLIIPVSGENLSQLFLPSYVIQYYLLIIMSKPESPTLPWLVDPNYQEIAIFFLIPRKSILRNHYYEPQFHPRIYPYPSLVILIHH